MRKTGKGIGFICCLITVLFLFTACSGNDNYSASSSADLKSQKLVYPDGLPESETVSISQIIDDLEKTVTDENIYFVCDNVEFLNSKAYYIFRKCEEKPDRVVTSAWFAADVFTGDIYKYNIGTGELEEI